MNATSLGKASRPGGTRRPLGSRGMLATGRIRYMKDVIGMEGIGDKRSTGIDEDCERPCDVVLREL